LSIDNQSLDISKLQALMDKKTSCINWWFYVFID